MPFDPTAASDVRAMRRDAELYVAWSSSSPPGTPHQLYLGGRLAWVGTATSATLPFPTSSRVTIDVGSVGPAEASTDFSGSLGPIADRVLLTWTGGDYLDDDGIISFRVYSGAAPGGAVSYTEPAGEVTAYPAGIVQGGFGLGGFGEGGFGTASGSYTWRSDVLTGGTWNFAVKAVDNNGNEGTAATVSVGISAPPLAPAADANGSRLTYTYNSTSHVATLNWLAATGAIAATRYRIYKNDGLGGPADYGTPIGTTAGLTFAPSAVATPSDTTFAVRTFDTGSGLEESNVDARVRLLVSASGSDLGNLPAPPSALSVVPTAGGGAVLRWVWTPSGTGAPPSGFRVYAATPTISYTTPAATVSFVGGRVAYSAALAGLADGSIYQVAVRAYNASGEEGNTVVVSVVGDASLPDAVDDLTAEATG